MVVDHFHGDWKRSCTAAGGKSQELGRADVLEKTHIAHLRMDQTNDQRIDDKDQKGKAQNNGDGIPTKSLQNFQQCRGVVSGHLHELAGH